VRIDIRSETQLAEGIPARRDELEEGVEYEEGQWVANTDTGVMEWHAADGSVISEAEWNAQAAAPTEPVAAEDAPAESGDDVVADDVPAAPEEAAAADETDGAEPGDEAVPSESEPVES
jgi:hypothetical protein